MKQPARSRRARLVRRTDNDLSARERLVEFLATSNRQALAGVGLFELNQPIAVVGNRQDQGRTRAQCLQPALLHTQPIPELFDTAAACEQSALTLRQFLAQVVKGGLGEFLGILGPDELAQG